MSNCGVFPLTEDILLAEILIRLPVKSIGKSRCVSKQWNSLLTSPRFIKAHLALHAGQKRLFIHNNRSLFTFTLCPDGVAVGTFKLLDSILPPIDDKKLRLVGHCNGLVLIAAIGEIFYLLINPTTLEHSMLPEPPIFASNPDEIHMGDGYGFGYDSSSDDYKFVLVSKFYNIHDPRFCRTVADIYSLKMKSWRRVSVDWPFIAATGTYPGAGVFVNGALHWLYHSYGDGDNFEIRALDLNTEKSRDIPSLGSLRLRGEPMYEDHSGQKHEYKDPVMIVSKGCLGVVFRDHFEARSDNWNIDIWTMNKYGMAESWTKNVCIPKSWKLNFQSTSWFWRDALVRCYRDKAIFYSFNHEKSFDLPLGRRSSRTIKYLFKDALRIDGLVFSESLVSPHHLDDSTQQHGYKEQSPSSHVRKKLKA